MKKLTLAPIALLLASHAIADNTLSVDAEVVAYVATGLSAKNPQALVFPDIVKPATGQGNYTVTVDPSADTVVYTGASAPGLALNGSNNNQNTSGSTTVGQRNYVLGDLEISGEAGYTYSLTVVVKDVSLLPSGMSYSSLIDTGGTTGTAGAANLQIDSDGTSNVAYGGTLTVGETTPSGIEEVTLTLNATISYR